MYGITTFKSTKFLTAFPARRENDPLPSVYQVEFANSFRAIAVAESAIRKSVNEVAREDFDGLDIFECTTP